MLLSSESLGRNARGSARGRAGESAGVSALVFLALVSLACGPQERPPARSELTVAEFDSLLTDLAGTATGDLSRAERWRMVGSATAGLPPKRFRASDLPDPSGPGARLVGRYCTQCHGLPVPHMHTAEEWPGVVRRMLLRARTLQSRLAHLPAYLVQDLQLGEMGAFDIPNLDQMDSIVSYLNRYALRPADAAKLPRGADADLFLHTCTGCHAPPSPGIHTPDEWPLVVARMQENMRIMGVPELPTAQMQRIIHFLRTESERQRRSK